MPASKKCKCSYHTSCMEYKSGLTFSLAGHVKAQVAFAALAGKYALKYVGGKALGCIKSSIG